MGPRIVTEREHIKRALLDAQRVCCAEHALEQRDGLFGSGQALNGQQLDLIVVGVGGIDSGRPAVFRASASSTLASAR